MTGNDFAARGGMAPSFPLSPRSHTAHACAGIALGRAGGMGGGMVHGKPGKVLEVGNGPDSALQEYEAAMAVAEKPSARKGDDGRTRRDLSERRAKTDEPGR